MPKKLGLRQIGLVTGLLCQQSFAGWLLGASVVSFAKNAPLVAQGRAAPIRFGRRLIWLRGFLPRQNVMQINILSPPLTLR